MARRDYYHEANAPKPNSIVPAVSAVVCSDDGRIVLHLRTDNGYWSLPGGGLDVGEDVASAIVREVKEETGFDVKIERLVGIYSDPAHVIAYDNGEVRQQFSICFSCRIASGSLAVSNESKEVRLFRPEEITELSIHPANRIRLDDFFEGAERPFIR